MSRRFIANTARRLIRRYGGVVDLYSQSGFTTSRNTGIRERTTTKMSCKALVFDSAEEFHDFFDTFHNKNTEAASGYIKTVDRIVLVTKVQLGNWNLTLKNYIVYENRKYEVIQIADYGPATLFAVKSTPADSFNVIINENVKDYMQPVNSGNPELDPSDVISLSTLSNDELDDLSPYELFFLGA